MDQAEAIARARSALYPKGLPHPGCDAVSAAFHAGSGCFVVHFPNIWWVNRKTLRKLARRREPIPAAPGVRDPSHVLVTVRADPGEVKIIDHP